MSTELRRAVRGLLIAALLLVGFAGKGILIAPPAAPEHVRAGEFDTDRALARLQRILGDQKPHPVDSAANDSVRDRLMSELRAIGLTPRVHEATDCSTIPGYRFVSCSHVRNVLATVPGRGTGRTLLLNAHYDSTPTGPGASDDGLGVATLLEIGSLLNADSPQRPVTLLFNEGEEFGLNGAHAFVTGDREANDVDSLINIDTRGVSGPALMHETSDPDGAALNIYAGSTKRPYANSISTDFAKLIPNSTDVTFFKPRGWTLLNYGIIGNETRYHSTGDTIAALGRDSVAHVGGETLAATRAMAAQANPAQAGHGRTVFTDLAGRTLLRLPIGIAAGLLALLVGGALVLAWRRRGLGKPLATAAVMVVAGMAAAALLSVALGLIRTGDFWRAHALIVYLALYSMLLLAMAAVWRRMGRGVEPPRIRAAAWLLILLFGALISFILPGAMIYFLLAPAMALIGVAIEERSPKAAAVLAVAATCLQFLMFGELLAAIEMLLIDGPLWAVAPLAAFAALPALVEIDPIRGRPVLALFGAAALVFSIAALAVPRSSAEQPLGFSIDYFRDAESNRANWAIATKQAPLPADFPGRWTKGVLPYNGRPRWIAPAPLLQTPVADVHVVASSMEGERRRVRLQLAANGANTIALRFPADAKLLAIGLPGRPVPLAARGEPDRPLFRCTGRSCDGLQVELLLGDQQPVTAEIFATHFGLPPQGQRFEAARPANAIPQYTPDQSITRSVIRF